MTQVTNREGQPGIWLESEHRQEEEQPQTQSQKRSSGGRRDRRHTVELGQRCSEVRASRSSSR